MNTPELWKTPREQTRPARLFSLVVFALLLGGGLPGVVMAEEDAAATSTTAAKQTTATDEMASADDDIITMAAYNVKADRIEDFGIRVRPGVAKTYPKTAVGSLLARYVPMVAAIIPNTAAARAGLQPGDRILKSDGQSLVGGALSAVSLKKWRSIQKRKWDEVAAGKTSVTWTLEVESPITKAVRIVTLVVPTPPPHWGASIWHAPEGRPPATVREAGPLAERSRAILDHGIWTSLGERNTALLGLDFRGGIRSDFASGREPTGYEWTINGGQNGSHRMIVTQFRGRTDIFLEARGPGSFRIYLTSPSGALEKTWRYAKRGESSEVPPEEARLGFEHELALWTAKIEKGTGRWPFEVKPGDDPDAIFAILAPTTTAAAVVAPPLTEDFLQLPLPTEAQRALLADAFGKLGADPDQWAYTETSRGLEDKRVLVTRVDPSKPDAEQSILLSIDGKAPKPADVQRWRDDGGDTPKPLGEIPPLASLVDLKELRVVKDETASVVFEAPTQSGGAEFPREKFQALFRVNKTHRAFEDITVKLRDSFRVAGVVKVVAAGLEMRFQMLDPALAPQPVFLKMGGGVRVLLVKFSRSFEATRTDFKRVVPFPSEAVPSGRSTL